VPGSPAARRERTGASRIEAWAGAAGVLALVLVADQALKQLALSSLERGQPQNIFFGLDLNLVRNTGIAFGAFAGAGDAVGLLTGAALVLLVVYFARNASVPGLWGPVGMLLGGALGNLADRHRDGSVIDFIDPYAWPAFNLADVCIVLGVLGLLYVIEGEREPGAG